MEKKGIEVILVYIKYDYDKKEREYRCKELFEVEPSEYPFFVKVGPWIHGGELLTQTYLKAKVQGSYQNVDIAVRMPQEQAVSVKAVNTQPKGYPYQKYADRERGLVYFTPPGKRDLTGHYTAGGSETIQISFADGQKEWMRLMAKVTEEEKDFYRELVFDLISMEQQLCIDDKSSMSMAVRWSDNLYKETETLIANFCNVFDALKNNAQPELKPFQTKESFHKIKKLSVRALIEHEIFHKDKVSAISYREDLDTFEHRAIKTHLNLLKKLVKVRRDMEISALENERARMQIRLNLSESELENRIGDLKQDLKEQIEEWGRKPEESKALCQMGVYIQFHVQDWFGTEQGILEFRHFRKKAQNRPEVFVKCFADSQDFVSRQQVIDIEGCRHRIWEGKGKGWSGWKKYELPGAKDTKYIFVSVPMYCTEAAAGLFYYLQSDERVIAKGSIVGICGTIVCNEKYYKKKDDGYAEFRFRFKEIHFLSLFDQKDGKISEIERVRYPISRASEEEKLQRKEAFYNFISESDNLGFYEEALEKKTAFADLDCRIRDEQKRKKRWTKLEEKLKQREETPLMQSTKSVRTPVQTSNLFTFHPDYRKMYAVMLADAQKMEGVEYYAKDPKNEFSVADLPHLYEIWSCLKLVRIFVQDYEFKLLNDQSGDYETGTDSLKKYIREVLKGGEFSGSRFDLQGDVGGQTMTVTIWYERRFFLDKEKLKSGGYFAKRKDGTLHERKSLVPDIVMQMQMGGKNCMFILDAKCKGKRFSNEKKTSDERQPEEKFSETLDSADKCEIQYYNGIQELCEVAFQKYTWELGNGMNPAQDPFYNWLTDGRIDGSFILHSCTDTIEPKSVNLDDSNGEKIEATYDPQNYLGAYPDALATHLWKKECEENKWEVSTDGLAKWAKWSGGQDNHENRLGIVVANPKLNRLPHLLQMIMERHFGAYRARCWICGSSDLHIEQKMTRGNFPKYYIRCNKCKMRTVETHCANSVCHLKLGKHLENYFAQQKSKNKKEDKSPCWNVSCPKCRKMAPRTMESGLSPKGQPR